MLLLIAGAATAAYFISRPKQRVVPSVTGEQLNLARTVLQNAGFSVGVIRVANARTSGTVIGEEPQAGTKADKNSTVTVTVSQGPGNTTVPSVQGLSQSRATRVIKRAKLRLSRTLRQPSSQFPAGQATGTDPAAGKSLPTGTSITLIVSSGPPAATVPNVTGDSEADATTALTTAGFKVNVNSQTSSTAQAGNVISQNPAGGSTAPPGSVITIVVASAPPTASVPNVVGDPAGQATSALTAAGFKVSRTTKDVTQQNQDGNVISQSPTGGSTAKKNSTVTIVVGRYKPPDTSTTTTSKSTTPTTSSTSSTSTSSSSAAAP